MSDQTVELLQAVVARLGALETAYSGLLSELQRQGRVDAGKSAADLLSAIAEAWGGRQFTTAEIVRHADAMEAASLRVAIISAVGADCAPARRLGKLLARIAGQDLGGLTVLSEGAEAAGLIWSVRPSVGL